ncbi:unnamed protein product [Effrenium voratum]|nr:unnamed protein product [Effrenium voratum]
MVDVPPHVLQEMLRGTVAVMPRVRTLEPGNLSRQAACTSFASALPQSGIAVRSLFQSSKSGNEQHVHELYTGTEAKDLAQMDCNSYTSACARLVQALKRGMHIGSRFSNAAVCLFPAMVVFFRRTRRLRLGVVLLCAFLVCEIAFLGPSRPSKSPDASSTRVVSKTVEMSDISTARVESQNEEHVSIPEILNRYGLPALVFHFVVWITTLTACYLVLSLNTALLQMLPEEIQQRVSAGSTLGYAAAALAAAEILGPVRLALTVAAAPTASRVARQYEWFCRMEEAIVGFIQDFATKVSQVFAKA